MGCKYACTCGANCLRCSQYEPESYFGEAEDILAQSKGFSSDDEWRHHQEMERQQEKEYYRAMDEYYQSLEEKEEKQ